MAIKGKLKVVVDDRGREYCIPVSVHEKPDIKPEQDKYQSSHNKCKKQQSKR